MIIVKPNWLFRIATTKAVTLKARAHIELTAFISKLVRVDFIFL